MDKDKIIDDLRAQLARQGQGEPVAYLFDDGEVLPAKDLFARIQTPELVAETNAWMASFFGYTELLPDGVVYELHGHTLVMNRATFNKAISAINKSAAQKAAPQYSAESAGGGA